MNKPKSKGKSNPKKSYPKKNYRKQSKEERIEESFSESKGKITPDARNLMRSADNDPQWYAVNAQLLKDYASYPFGIPLGAPIGGQDSVYTSAIPGVAAIKFKPTVGVASDETSPINVAMRKLYSYVRHANSGAKNYDAPDLMLYVVAVDSARMYLEFMKRAYGVFMNYTAFNRYYPRALIYAMGLDYSDLEASLNDFRGYINQYAVKLNQLWVPAGFSYFKRHEWLCQHVYVDSKESAKAQTYFFTPTAFYQFSVSGTPAVGSLKSTLLPSSRCKLAQLITFGNSLLDPLITNEDIGIMSGDILKAYGNGGVMTTTGITEDYRVLPEYSEEVMSQIENLSLCNVSNLNVTQNTAIGGGYLVSAPKGYVQVNSVGTPAAPATQYQQNFADALVSMYSGSRLLNLHNMDSSPESVIVATRGMISINADSVVYDTSVSDPAASFSLSSCGSEVFIEMAIVSTNGASLNVGKGLYNSNWQYVSSADVDQLITAYNNSTRNYQMVSQFDWHPDIQNMVMVDKEGDFAWSTPRYPFLDVDNYTFIDSANVSNMHMIALLSEFTVPMVG